MKILILTALYPEAEFIIKATHLKKTPRKEFQEFVSEQGDLTLAVTGTGPVSAAAVTAIMLSGGPSVQGYTKKGFLSEVNEKSTRFQHILSFGTAAALRREAAGHLYRCHTLLDLASGRFFYPDLITKMDIPEASLITGSQILRFSRSDRADSIKTEHYEERACSPAALFKSCPAFLSDYDLYDMEAFAIARAASMYLGPHQMTFLKAASDFGNPDSVTPESLRDFLWKSGPAVMDVLAQIAAMQEMTETKAGTPLLPSRLRQEILAFAGSLHCSFSMQHELEIYIRYAEAAGIDWRSIRDSLPEEIFPSATRRQGKEVLKAFESFID